MILLPDWVQRILAIVLSCSVGLHGEGLVLAEGFQSFPLFLHFFVPVGLVCEELIEGERVDVTENNTACVIVL